MQAYYVIALLISGASAELGGCVADPNLPGSCREEIPSGDVTSLLQRVNLTWTWSGRWCCYTPGNIAMQNLHRDWIDCTTCPWGYGSVYNNECIGTSLACWIVDCQMSNWNPWSACSATCGSGTRTRSRTVTQEPLGRGKPCGDLEASEACKVKECPVPCELSEWEDWGDCSTTCGKGTRTRTRSVKTESQHGGQECENAREASEDCKPKECPMDFGPLALQCLFVKDQTNMDPISGVTVKVVGDYTGETDTDGKICFHLRPSTKVTFAASADGWISKTSDEVTVPSEGNLPDIFMSKKLAATGWGIVMTWKEKPTDLDAWLYLDQRSGCTVNYYRKDRTCSANGVRATLDLDNTDITELDKPETVSLTDVDPENCGDTCFLHYLLVDFTNRVRSSSHEIFESQASVEVSHGDESVDRFTMNPDGTVTSKKSGSNLTPVIDEADWYVFAIDIKTGKVIPCTKPAFPCF